MANTVYFACRFCGKTIEVQSKVDAGHGQHNHTEIPFEILSDIKGKDVTCKHCKATSTISARYVYAQLVDNPEATALRKAVREMVQGFEQTVEFLQLQLNHAWGNLTDAEFTEQAKPYMHKQESNKDIPTLESQIRLLFDRFGIKWDAAMLADVYGCDLANACSMVYRVNNGK